MDNDHIKLSWLIDWTKEEVLFNVDHAFDENDKWFSFGFSKRGDFEQSDICFFFKNDENSVVKFILFYIDEFFRLKLNFFLGHLY